MASFVANNARRVLGVEAARVLPVSARSALDAKLAATKENRGFFGIPTLLPYRVMRLQAHSGVVFSATRTASQETNQEAFLPRQSVTLPCRGWLSACIG